MQVTVTQVLFICVHNVGRSQMAAALLDHHAFGRVAVRSAGSQPAGEMLEITTTAFELGEGWGTVAPLLRFALIHIGHFSS